MSDIPFIKFFPTDWLSEETLRLVSMGARGLWIDLLCLMARSNRRGYLELAGGIKPTSEQIARLLGRSVAEIEPLLDELKQAGTFSIDESGIIYSRRIVRDTESYNQAVMFGKKGGNPRLKNRDKGGINGTVRSHQQPSLGSGFWISSSGFSESFRAVWDDWMAYRSERKFKPYTERGLKALANELKTIGEGRATAAIKYSMAMNWQGIFEKKSNSPSSDEKTTVRFNLAMQ